MILTILVITSAAIAVSPHCLADNSNSLRPFLNRPYKLDCTDENFDKVLEHLGIGWIRRKAFQLVRPELTLTWNPVTNIYTITEQSLFVKVDAPFEVVITFLANLLKYEENY